jgi:hypothetical protein
MTVAAGRFTGLLVTALVWPDTLAGVPVTVLTLEPGSIIRAAGVAGVVGRPD